MAPSQDDVIGATTAIPGWVGGLEFLVPTRHAGLSVLTDAKVCEQQPSVCERIRQGLRVRFSRKSTILRRGVRANNTRFSLAVPRNGLNKMKSRFWTPTKTLIILGAKKTHTRHNHAEYSVHRTQ